MKRWLDQIRWLPLLMLLAFAAALSDDALAQTAPGGTPVVGGAQYRGTVNAAAVITTGGTFQSVLPSIIGTTSVRQSVTIENNNATDSCWIFIGPMASATEGKSILLLAGGSYQRYWPYVPPDNIAATCANNSDTLYVDTQ